MGYISSYRRMVIWVVGTLLAIAGAAIFGWQLMQHSPSIWFIYSLVLLLGGVVVITINETVFSVRKERLEIDRDETIKSSGEKHPHSPMILAICPQCKSRIPSDAKYCLECGTDLQRQTP